MRKVILITTVILIFVSLFIFKSQQPLEGYGISHGGAIVMDDEYFGFLYYDIEANPDKYAAQKVVITGFVYKEPDIQNNEIKVSRILLQKCGSQEDEILGINCIVPNESDYKDDEWVTVKGTLIVKSFLNTNTKKKSYNYYIEPESIEKIEKNSDSIL